MLHLSKVPNIEMSILDGVSELGKNDEEFDPFGLIKERQNSLLRDGTEDSATKASFPIAAPEAGAGEAGETEIVSGSLSYELLSAPPVVSRVSRSLTSVIPKGLPPKLTVKLTIYEEASSFGHPEKEGASDVTIEGRICAQVQCSDANRNAPFCLEATDTRNYSFLIRPNMAFGIDPLTCSPRPDKSFDIPKHEIGFVPIATYSASTTVQHMPLLLERKVTITGTSCRVAIQVRTKLSNKGDMGDFSIAMAVPEYVDGNSIDVQRGDGTWDELKRTVKWKRSFLKKGESFLVSAKAELLDGFSKEELRFPIMLRCSSSSDQISGLNFNVVKAEGHPASIAVHKTYSFLLLHRLP